MFIEFPQVMTSTTNMRLYMNTYVDKRFFYGYKILMMRFKMYSTMYVCTLYFNVLCTVLMYVLYVLQYWYVL